MANAYFYSNTAIQTTLSGSISAGATSIAVAATTGFPGSFPYVLALDYGSGTEELVSVTNAAGTTLTVSRGHSGTSAQSHSLGAVVRHVWHAGDASDFRTHEAATSDVHGVTGALVGATMVQTLTNKTLTAPTITNGAYSGGGSLAGTFTGTPTLSGAVVLSGTPNISNGAALAGTFTGTPTFSGALTFSGGPTFTTLSALWERASAGDNAIRTRVAGDSNSRFIINADGQVTWGSGSATGDVTIYRDSASILGIDDTVRWTRSAAGDDVVHARVSGDAGIRYLLEASGAMGWGAGSGFTMDTNLYRSSAGLLKTDGNFEAGGTVTATNIPKILTGSTTFNFSAVSQVDNVISLTSGNFSGTPKVVAMLTSSPGTSSALTVRATSISSSSLTLRCLDTGGASRTLSITADWVAVGS